MTCKSIELPTSHGTVTGFACSRGPHPKCQEVGCGANSEALCDYPVARHRGPQTCDRRMCGKHRKPVPGKENADYCGVHAKVAGLR